MHHKNASNYFVFRIISFLIPLVFVSRVKLEYLYTYMYIFFSLKGKQKSRHRFCLNTKLYWGVVSNTSLVLEKS